MNRVKSKRGSVRVKGEPKALKRIALLTSGGDAPGMNAAIRAIVRAAISKGLEVYGIHQGYEGLIDGEMEPMGSRSVSNIIQRGGTILRTARSERFRTPEGLARARVSLVRRRIEGLIAIGGDGTFRGACDLARIWKGRIIGLPGTIDNDLYGTDETVGFDTAINTGLEAIDKVRDTADAHERIFIVEVMGRQAGFIALDVGIGGGAEAILVPEYETDLEAIGKRLCEGIKKGKMSSIIVLAEGDEAGNAYTISEKLKELTGQDFRVVVLGHIQRGGSPTARDRKLATRLGAFAVECLEKGGTGVMVGEIKGRLATTPLNGSFKRKKKLDAFTYNLIHVLSQ